MKRDTDDARAASDGLSRDKVIEFEFLTYFVKLILIIIV